MAGSAVQGGSAAGTVYPVPPVVLGGLDSTGAVRALLTDSTGRISVTAGSPLAAGLGVQFEPFPIASATSASLPGTQNLSAAAIYATAGAIITGIKIRNGVAAAGTNPTTVRLGIADLNGKILAVSGNYGTGGTNNATTVFALGANAIPLSAPLTLTYSGIYFPCFVVNGAWGTTQPTPIFSAGTGTPFGADGVNPPVCFSWASQTDLPAVGSSLTMNGLTGRVYYLALY